MASVKFIHSIEWPWLVCYGLFGWRGEGGGVKGSRVLLAKNKLILC